MKRLFIVVVLNLCCLLAVAAVPSHVRAEIEALLTRLQASGCQFNRNGSWYSGAEARAHLLRKLNYIEEDKGGKDALQHTEQFIEMAASQSSFSGKSYQVRCDGQPSVTSKLWLSQQLAIIRAEQEGEP